MLRNTLTSKKSTKVVNGTANDPIIIIPGITLMFSNPSQQRLNNTNVARNKMKTLLYNHGLVQVADIWVKGGVVFFVPQMNTDSASSVVCDLNTLVNKSFQFSSEVPVLPIYSLIFWVKEESVLLDSSFGVNCCVCSRLVFSVSVVDWCGWLLVDSVNLRSLFFVLTSYITM